MAVDVVTPMNLRIPPHAREEWAALAAALCDRQAPCETGDADDWFVRTPDAAAVAACGTCPARQPCLRYAMAADERHGVWGATTATERRQLAADAA